MEKILALLGIDKLDEATQNELKEKLQTIIEVKAKELSEESLEEQRQTLIGEYEEKFDEYKDDITGKFSNFIDSVLQKELVIPEAIQEFAKKGQLYSDLIEQFRVRLGVDQGLLDEETTGLLREARDEIAELRDKQDQSIAENLNLRADAQELAASVYLYKKCEGLTEAQKAHVFSILDGITDRDEIDRKFDIIKESERFDPVNVGNAEGEKVIKKEKKKSDPKSNEKQVKEQEDENGNGKSEVDDEDEDAKKKKKKKEMEEADNPFTDFKKQYMKVLVENRIT